MPYSPETEQYRRMQQAYYEAVDHTQDSALERIIGSVEDKNNFPYEQYLLEHLDPAGKIALDFACGPGRMIRRMAHLFQRIDGADISSSLLKGAERWTKHLENPPRLYHIDGVMLGGVPSGEYDLVYSTWSFHHIARHDVRMSLLREFHRVLVPGGRVAIQMFYTTHPRETWMHHSDWRENPDNLQQTNGWHDTRITPDNLLLVREDFESVGFTDFSTTMTPFPDAEKFPVERATDWIFLHGRKKWD